MFSTPGATAAFHSARNAFLDSLFTDMLGFGACKMIRRILGFAHVIDFESIQDAALRADCEAGALAMAHALLTHPEQFRSVDDVIDAVPRMVRRATPPGAPRGKNHVPPPTASPLGAGACRPHAGGGFFLRVPSFFYVNL